MTAAPDSSTIAETRALHLLRDGYSPAQVIERTGVTRERLEVLARTFGASRPQPPRPAAPVQPAAPQSPRPAAPTHPVRMQPAQSWPPADAIGELVAQAKESRVAAVRRAAEKVDRVVNELRATIRSAENRERELAQEAEEKAARQRAIADAEKALKAAQERLKAARAAARGKAAAAATSTTAAPTEPAVEKVPPDKRRAQIPRLLELGVSRAEMARRFGVSDGQIYQDIKAIEAAP